MFRVFFIDAKPFFAYDRFQRLQQGGRTLPFIAHMDPKARPMTMDEFRARFPAPAIALDGFVDEPPMFDPKGPYRNFDHHRGPPRDDMMCTAQQVLRAVRKGLVDYFIPTGRERVTVAMNDCDPDVCLAWYALSCNFATRAQVNPAIHRLFGHVDSMDNASGLIDVPRDVLIVRQAAWIFEPYWQFRFSGAIDQKDERQHLSVLQQVTTNVGDFVAGRGDMLEIDDRYDRIGGGEDWAMVREYGQHARMKMARHGIKAFVSVRQNPAGRYVYTICRQSAYIGWFPIPELCAFLNQDEDPDCHFGGGDIVHGNARGRGSDRGPDELADAINAFKKQYQFHQP